MINNAKLVEEAMIKHQQMLSQIMFPATISFLKKFCQTKGATVLDLNCGEGDVVFQLAEFVGEEGKVIGIDWSKINIHTAQQLANIRRFDNVVFHQMKPFRLEHDRLFDFIHCRLQLTHLANLPEMVEELWKCLRPGGLLLLEEINFSAFNSIPKNFAFERFLEVYTNLQYQFRGDTIFSSGLSHLLLATGFQQVRQQYVFPQLLKDRFKPLVSLTWQCLQDKILLDNLITPEEFQILLCELKAFEKQENILISLPGIYQIWGYKEPDKNK